MRPLRERASALIVLELLWRALTSDLGLTLLVVAVVLAALVVIARSS